MRGAGIRRAAFGAAALTSAMLGMSALSSVASATADTPPPTPPTTAAPLPPVPNVPTAITAGKTAQDLLTNAIALSSLGVDSSSLTAAISATQARMDADAIRAKDASRQAAEADRQAVAARASAQGAAKSLTNMTSAVKTALIYLYTEDGRIPSVDPHAGAIDAYAEVYAEATASPWGVLAQRQDVLTARQGDLKRASQLQKQADDASAKAASALAAQQGEATRLRAELASMSASSADAVLADHVNLTNQVSTELLSTASLEFTPSKPLPAPVSTTAVALTWAFAELGKPYVWGATGPNSFDCSGLTQYVWRQAGVAIPRVAADQDAWAIPVPLSQLLPGDLVFYGTTEIHHVGIYIGGGLMINAPHTGDVVRVSSIWWSDLAGFGRVHAPGTPVPAHLPPSIDKPIVPAVIPTAGPVPSQTKPPPGWKPTPGSTTPIDLGTDGGSRGTVPGGPSSTTSTTTGSTPTSDETTTTLPDVSDTTTTVDPGNPDGSIPGGDTTTTSSTDLPSGETTTTTIGP